ncbi:DNA-damage-inducible protein I [Shimwellia blattae DSM 4481 = NBRC 105725]|uniref:DNA-damage-inducible protein I n=2 Tax=Shimwellia blattae TaxID=563 RepID=I2B905_SHIBC|nr:DNA-damage-inducible protein I [Shimwellia blattae DSM 4481 = NBRC 105725]GAB80868.1 hypothetical protein EB105725_10_00550 [Shimwellia blattae DSM 4481 = NBRC 105725]
MIYLSRQKFRRTIDAGPGYEYCIYIQYSNRDDSMYVELIYDKRNVAGLPGAREIILDELTRRVQRIFPEADVRVKPMQANALNSDASKSDREKLNRMLEEMFDEADMWLVSDAAG